MQKKYLCLSTLLLCFVAIASKAQTANTTLSNLTSPTKVNVSLLPSKDSAINLGSTAKSWKDFFIKGKIYLADTPTIYSINNSDFFAGPNAGIKLKFLSGQRNTGIGANALYYGGYSNTAVGWESLTSDSTGSYNTALGALSLLNNTSGNENTAVGNAALYKSLNGSYNTAVGSSALSGNFSGSDNVALGAYALTSDRAGDNTAVGYQSLFASTTAFNNSALGYNSLFKCLGGFQNTAIGYNAGSNVTNGDDNTFIGTNANSGSTGDVENGTALGYAAIVTSNNHVRIGNTSVTSIGGQVAWTNFSDERIKTNIKENVPGLLFINLLRPVTYSFNVDKQQEIMRRKDTSNRKGKYDINKIQFTGFLAQEVEAAAKKINYDFSGVDAPQNDEEVYGLRYSDFVVPLVRAVQELSAQNDSLKKEDLLQKEINKDLETRLSKLEAMMNVQSSSSPGQIVNTNNIATGLSQNVPNPFSNATTMSYSIPQHYSSASIIITDKKGNFLKQVPLSNSEGSVNIDGSTLSSGAYQYSLYVDGKLIDSKQMQSVK
jgi:hypothetical protein